MAYATLDIIYGNLSQTTQRLQNLRKAFELKDRASEREKLYISAHYYDEDSRNSIKPSRFMSSGSRPIRVTRFPGITWRSDTVRMGYPEKCLANPDRSDAAQSE